MRKITECELREEGTRSLLVALGEDQGLDGRVRDGGLGLDVGEFESDELEEVGEMFDEDDLGREIDEAELEGCEERDVRRETDGEEEMDVEGVYGEEGEVFEGGEGEDGRGWWMAFLHFIAAGRACSKVGEAELERKSSRGR